MFVYIKTFLYICNNLCVGVIFMIEKITNLLHNSEYMIPNLDIDGFFSAAILKKVKPEIQTCGFSNSHDIVYIFQELEKEIKRKNTIYIDLYTKNCMCIDQHVVSYTQDYNNLLRQNKKKLNPNIEFNRIGKQPFYYWKYPFSSAMWLIYCFNKIGIRIDIDYNKIVFDDITLAELFFHADSMLYNKIVKNHLYEENINKWWELLLIDNENNNVTELCNLYNSYSDERIEYAHKKIGTFLQTNFLCAKNGGYNEIKNNIVKDKINDFINFICGELSVEPFINNLKNQNLQTIKFFECKNVVIKNDEDFDEIINQNNIFSFAFVFNNRINYSWSKKDEEK